MWWIVVASFIEIPPLHRERERDVISNEIVVSQTADGRTTRQHTWKDNVSAAYYWWRHKEYQWKLTESCSWRTCCFLGMCFLVFTRCNVIRYNCSSWHWYVCDSLNYCVYEEDAVCSFLCFLRLEVYITCQCLWLCLLRCWVWLVKKVVKVFEVCVWLNDSGGQYSCWLSTHVHHFMCFANTFLIFLCTCNVLHSIFVDVCVCMSC